MSKHSCPDSGWGGSGYSVPSTYDNHCDVLHTLSSVGVKFGVMSSSFSLRFRGSGAFSGESQSLVGRSSMARAHFVPRGADLEVRPCTPHLRASQPLLSFLIVQ